MYVQDAIKEAIDVILGWDLPDEAVSEAVMAQAVYMTRGNFEEIRGFPSD